MKKVLIILSLITILLTGCSKEKLESEQTKVNEYIEGESINKYLIEIDSNKYIEKVNQKETFMIFIGSNSCSACKKFKPIITKFANEKQLEIYFIDLLNINEEERTEIYNIQSINYLPTLLIFDKGKVVYNEYGVKYYDYLEDLVIEYNLGE